MGDSKIEWTDWTWNPVTGCSKVSQGCKFCYAERIWPKVEGARVKREGGEPRAFTDVWTHSDRLDQPLRMRKPRRIFVNSMSDLFHEDVPDEYIDKVFAVMNRARWHTYQVLTKRAARMQDYVNHRDRKYRIMRAAAELPLCGVMDMPWPIPHVWLGVSVEDQATADERTPLLLRTPAFVRFISYEPALGPVDWYDALGYEPAGPIGMMIPTTHRPKVDWIIGGGESGPHARPSHPQWFRDTRDQCHNADVPFFFKQWGEWARYDEESAIDRPDSAIRFVAFDGRTFTRATIESEGRLATATMARVGKKAAGRVLDGRVHDEYPT